MIPGFSIFNRMISPDGLKRRSRITNWRVKPWLSRIISKSRPKIVELASEKPLKTATPHPRNRSYRNHRRLGRIIFVITEPKYRLRRGNQSSEDTPITANIIPTLESKHHACPELCETRPVAFGWFAPAACRPFPSFRTPRHPRSWRRRYGCGAQGRAHRTWPL